MQKHDSEGLPDPDDNRPPPGSGTTFWLGVTIACLLATITVMLVRRWF